VTDISAVVQLQETVLQATIGNPDPGSGTDLTLGASVADVLSLAGQQLNAEGPAGDVLLFWDASAGKLTYLSLGTGLSITSSILTVTAAGTGTVTSVNISQPAAGITVSGGPITSSGSITLALANDLAAVEGLSGTGIVRRTAADTWSAGTAVDLSSEVTGQLPYTSLAGAPNLSLKADLIGGVIPTSQLPSLAITEFLGTAANQAAMLTFSGQRGDWCIRTDAGANGGTWVLVVDGGSSLAHWQRLGYPIAPVSSVNSQTGDVVLGFGDVGAAPADQGVTNGNSHNHDGGDGAQIAYNSLLGLPGVVSPSSAGLAPARSFSTITYGATVALDFASLDAQYRTISLTGNLELTTSNLANGRTLVIRLVADANQRTLTFPTDWKFLGTKPANIAASKVGVLSITAFGTTNADVVAAYAVQS
jgi:hypothetical protein